MKMRQRVGSRKVLRYRRETGLPVVEALVRGNTEHRVDLLLEDGSIVEWYPTHGNELETSTRRWTKPFDGPDPIDLGGGLVSDLWISKYRLQRFFLRLLHDLEREAPLLSWVIEGGLWDGVSVSTELAINGQVLIIKLWVSIPALEQAYDSTFHELLEDIGQAIAYQIHQWRPRPFLQPVTDK